MQSLLLCAYVLFNLVSHTCNLFSFVQHQSAASNQPHDLAPSQWNSGPKWSPVVVNSWPKYLWFYLFLLLWIICDYLWLRMSYDYYLWILKFTCIYVLLIYLYELPVMSIVNYLWWMWCLFECGTWLWPNQINWLFVASLPSVTLGKEPFCRVPGVNHSAK